MTITIKTASWFQPLPDDHLRIGISRGVPRRMAGGFRIYKTLAPGAWFNSVSIERYDELYRTEILDRLDPQRVAIDLQTMAGLGRITVMLCYETAGKGQWCHRAMVAEWLAKSLGITVPEFGFEQLPQDQHPLMPPQLRRGAAGAATGTAPAR